MNEIFSFVSGENIVNGGLTILCLLISLAAIFIARFFKNKADLLKKDRNNSEISSILLFIENVVDSAVKATNQTFVDDLKESGEFNSDSWKEAFDLTKKQIESVITTDLRLRLENVIFDFNDYIEMLIENKVALNNLINKENKISSNNKEDCYEEDDDYNEFPDEVFKYNSLEESIPLEDVDNKEEN